MSLKLDPGIAAGIFLPSNYRFRALTERGDVRTRLGRDDTYQAAVLDIQPVPGSIVTRHNNYPRGRR